MEKYITAMILPRDEKSHGRGTQPENHKKTKKWFEFRRDDGLRSPPVIQKAFHKKKMLWYTFFVVYTSLFCMARPRGCLCPDAAVSHRPKSVISGDSIQLLNRL